MKDKRTFPKWPILFISTLSFILFSSIAFGATINVPGDQPTIQAGIDAASDGDTVLVADGTYTGEGNKNLDFKGKAITVQSENGAESCIIDCENEGRGFYFHTGEGVDSVVSGFTITNGRPTGATLHSGGIYCSSSSPTITNCIISNNLASFLVMVVASIVLPHLRLLQVLLLVVTVPLKMVAGSIVLFPLLLLQIVVLVTIVLPLVKLEAGVVASIVLPHFRLLQVLLLVVTLPLQAAGSIALPPLPP